MMSGVQYPSIGLPMECADGDELASDAEGGLPLLALRPLRTAAEANCGAAAVDRPSSDVRQLELPPAPAAEYCEEEAPAIGGGGGAA